MANRLLVGLNFDHVGFMSPQRIKTIRNLYRATQIEFAELMGVSYHTYKNWEIGHRLPSSPAAALLYIAENNPKVFYQERLKFISAAIQGTIDNNSR